MSAAERRKGQRGQLAVRRLFEAHGWDWTPTGASAEGKCDGLARRGGVTLAVEVKNQAVLRLPLWRRQTIANAPAGTTPVLVYKRRGEWIVNYWEGVVWFTAPLADAFGAPVPA